MDLTNDPILQEYVFSQKEIVKKAVVKDMGLFEIRRLEWEYPFVSKKKPEQGDLGISRKRNVYCFYNGKWQRWTL